MTEDTEQINVEVPSRTKQLAKEELEHGGLTRVVREKLTEIAHGVEVSEMQRIKDQLTDLRDERKRLKRKRSEIDSQLEDISVKIERAENKIEQLQDKQGEYEGALQMIEEEMRADADVCVWEGHGKVQNAARIGDCAEQDVLDDLQQRNPEFDDDRFEKNIGMV